MTIDVLSASVEDAVLHTARRSHRVAPRLLRVQALLGANAHFNSTVMVIELGLGRYADPARPMSADAFSKRFIAEGGDEAEAQNASFLAKLRNNQPVAFAEAMLVAIQNLERRLAKLFNTHDAIAYAAWSISAQQPSQIVVWQTHRPLFSRRLAFVAYLGLRELLGEPSRKVDFKTRLARLEGYARRRRLTSSTALIMNGARQRGFPARIVSGQYLEVGYGVNQRVFASSITPATAVGPSRVALNKETACKQLRHAGIAVPRHRRVKSLAGALRAAREVGYPIVIKPIRLHSGQGILVGIRTPEELREAYQETNADNQEVLIEGFVVGNEHRMLVVEGKLVAVVRRETPRVVGDGQKSIRDLIAALNADPRRNGISLHQIALNTDLERTLRWDGLNLDTVPEKGRVVIVSRLSNVSKGATPIDVTDSVHPDNAQLAVRAAQIIGLDVAGVDVISNDLSKSWRETPATVIEVNARPGIHIHVYPIEGKPRDVVNPIMNLTFPSGRLATAPTFVVGGDRGIASVALSLAELLRGTGGRVATSMGDRGYVDQTAIDLADQNRVDATGVLLRQSDFDQLVVASSLRRVARRGLVLEACSGAVILPMRKPQNPELFDQGLSILLRATQGPIVVSAKQSQQILATGLVNSERLVLVDYGIDNRETLDWIVAGRSAAIRVWRIDGPTMEFYAGGRLMSSRPLATQAEMRQHQIEAEMLAFAMVQSWKVREHSATPHADGAPRETVRLLAGLGAGG